jgi:hypothetical protein
MIPPKLNFNVFEYLTKILLLSHYNIPLGSKWTIGNYFNHNQKKLAHLQVSQTQVKLKMCVVFVQQCF